MKYFIKWKIVLSPIFTVIVSKLKAHGSKDGCLLVADKRLLKTSSYISTASSSHTQLNYLQKASLTG